MDRLATATWKFNLFRTLSSWGIAYTYSRPNCAYGGLCRREPLLSARYDPVVYLYERHIKCMAEKGNRSLYGNHSTTSWWRCPNIQGRVASLISSLAGALSHITHATDSSLPWKHLKILLINPTGHIHFIRIFTASPTILRWMVLELYWFFF